MSGTLNERELRRLGLPWSESLVQRSFFAVGGTIGAAYSALEDGLGSNLAGGPHHAFSDRGEGFCVLNDVAIAIHVLRRDGLIRRAAVIDCDVHQGDGTARSRRRRGLFYLLMHGAKNYPLFKVDPVLLLIADGTAENISPNTGPHLPVVSTCPTFSSTCRSGSVPGDNWASALQSRATKAI